MHGLALQLPNEGPWTTNGRTLARLVNAIARAPELVDRAIDVERIVLVGHSFGASSVAVALAEGAPALGSVMLDAAGIGKDLPGTLKRIRRPVMLVWADRDIGQTRNQPFFYRYIASGVAEVSIRDASHEDAQFPTGGQLPPSGGALASDAAQITFASLLTATAFSLAANGRLDYVWASLEGGLGSGLLYDARRK